MACDVLQPALPIAGLGLVGGLCLAVPALVGAAQDRRRAVGGCVLVLLAVLLLATSRPVGCADMPVGSGSPTTIDPATVIVDVRFSGVRVSRSGTRLAVTSTGWKVGQKPLVRLCSARGVVAGPGDLESLGALGTSNCRGGPQRPAGVDDDGTVRADLVVPVAVGVPPTACDTVRDCLVIVVDTVQPDRVSVGWVPAA